MPIYRKRDISALSVEMDFNGSFIGNLHGGRVL